MANTKTNSGTASSNREAIARPMKSADMQPCGDIVEYLKAYAREKPDVAALWCFGIGFIVGWKLKPW